MKKKILLILLIMGLIILPFVFLFIQNSKDKNYGIGLIDTDGFKNFETSIYGFNNVILFNKALKIRNTYLSGNSDWLYHGAKQISAEFVANNTSIIPDIYIDGRFVCVIEDGLHKKENDIMKIQYLSDERNPVRVGYILKDIRFIYVAKLLDDNVYEVNIPYQNGMKIALYNQEETSTCIINGKIIIE